MNNLLIADKKYNGKYVAFKSFNENTVIASDKDPAKVAESADKQGYTDSVIVYVPNNDEVHAL